MYGNRLQCPVIEAMQNNISQSINNRIIIDRLFKLGLGYAIKTEGSSE